MIGLWLSKPESSEQRVTLKIDANIKLIRMKHDQQLIDFVERHLRGELSPEELAEFDQLCVEDQEVKNIVIEHQSFIQHLTVYGARKRLVSDMEEAYQQFKVGGIVKQREKTFTIKKLWHTYRSHITVAASVALFAVITTWTLMRHFSDSGSTSYSILRREVNSLKQSQNALIRNINGKPVNKPEDSGRFRGTGFAILHKSDRYFSFIRILPLILILRIGHTYCYIRNDRRNIGIIFPTYYFGYSLLYILHYFICISLICTNGQTNIYVNKVGITIGEEYHFRGNN